MRKLIILALVGFAAQLVDGSLGMAYGVTSSTLLVAVAGLTPAAASASVHFSEIVTTAVSGVSHWRLRNVDWRVVARIAGPGALGAFLGATVLSRLSTEVAAPVMGVILLLLGLYILIRFVVGFTPRLKGNPTIRTLGPLGLFAGFVDATGGGGWGPVGTPALLADGRLEPRKVVGSIDTSEFAVSVAASVGFLLGLGAAGIDWGIALALLVGGVVAAPIAAVLVRYAPAHLLGVLVGGVIVLTNSRTLLRAAEVDPGARWWVYGAVVVLTAAALAWTVRRVRRRRETEAAAAEPERVGASS
ncbi:sulfite exporter TauE/SafE family protein [Desertihabitans brevis]|uniref:Probable membrane transporter protein n=2 Tax=Desertihabitans TaxID=2676837 RepID=A0A367YYN7_9ACTN|nr:sulfite exporter TauE/SafE family protein [Desertihabitans brevis]RCK70817.1 sulfite exporter TauE/SafE family protein [Desertihabitans brevis]